MDTIFEDLKGQGVEIYMDDIIIHGPSKERHDILVQETIKRLKKQYEKKYG